VSQVREGRRHRELTRLICVCRSLELVRGELVNHNLFVVNQAHYTSRLSRPVERDDSSSGWGSSSSGGGGGGWSSGSSGGGWSSGSSGGGYSGGSSSGGGYSGGSSSGGGASSSWAVPNNSRFEIISDDEEEKGAQASSPRSDPRRKAEGSE